MKPIQVFLIALFTLTCGAFIYTILERNHFNHGWWVALLVMFVCAYAGVRSCDDE